MRRGDFYPGRRRAKSRWFAKKPPGCRGVARSVLHHNRTAQTAFSNGPKSAEILQKESHSPKAGPTDNNPPSRLHNNTRAPTTSIHRQDIIPDSTIWPWRRAKVRRSLRSWTTNRGSHPLNHSVPRLRTSTDPAYTNISQAQHSWWRYS